MSTTWTWTDDPADPCSLCVNWVDGEGEWGEEHPIPLLAPGRPATRLYRGEHPECAQMVADYEADHANDPF